MRTIEGVDREWRALALARQRERVQLHGLADVLEASLATPLKLEALEPGTCPSLRGCRHQQLSGGGRTGYPRRKVDALANPVALALNGGAGVNAYTERQRAVAPTDLAEDAHGEAKGWSQTTSQRLKSTKLGSAEVIAEAPSSSGDVLPLADFGTLGFTGAVVNGSLLTSASLGVDPITMASGGTVKAAPSSLISGSFSDAWQHA